jgi:quercetin dioxygenase-like cupin family protein
VHVAHYGKEIEMSAQHGWTRLAAVTALVIGAMGVAGAQQSAPPAQTVPGSTAPAPVKTVTAEAKAVAVVPDAAKTPLAIKVNDPNLQWAACPALFPAGCRLAVLRGDPGKPGADVFFQVPGGYSIPAHSHTSAERMVLVTGELEVTYQGVSPVVLQAGQYAYGPAKAPHAARCRSQNACTLFIAFDLPVDAMKFDGKL